MSDELKSRFAEVYPPHECSRCKLKHTYVPIIVIEQKVEGEIKQVPLIPFEVVGLIEGSSHPGQRHTPEISTPAHIISLFWGVPGAPKADTVSILYLN